ncbi:acetylglutamate synthase [Phlyctema vagabunda]|uniref:Amino-acid acetyltransferase, mitochondrial n=1 Tax=Phlyctema vagabunda TaxID=108571 RepID=A0ABR4P4Y0_9HELO
MILQKMALKKGNAVAGHGLQSWVKRERRCLSLTEDGIRYFATENGARNQSKDSVDASQNKHQPQKKFKSIDRDFFLSVLGSSATKRDARSYLQAFTPPKDEKPPSPKTIPAPPKSKSRSNGVNLGAFYGPVRAVAESPRFVQPSAKTSTKPVGPVLHVALVKIRDPQSLDEDALYGVGKTLSQLNHLGLTSTVVLDCGTASSDDDPAWKTFAIRQADRIVRAIDAHGMPGARVIDNIIGVSEKTTVDSPWVKGKTHISHRKLLMTPLRRGMIPVIPAIGYTDVAQTAVPVKAHDVVLALVKELSGFQAPPQPDENPNIVKEHLDALRKEISLDRLIILDPLGGIPTSERPNGYHVFLNMEQEYAPARQDLLRDRNAEAELPWKVVSNSSKIHVDNLDLVHQVLAILPPTSSALLTTPDEAANSGKEPEGPLQALGVGTRRRRNPLIHNLLTDKPAFSSSLPIGRLGPPISGTGNEPISPHANITPTTFAKHGMSISIFPDPNISAWEPPSTEKPALSLTGSQIDMPRLVHLIEDSFDRKLDVKDFLRRVEGRIAGVIIAGEYEGGALLTWELPPGVPDDGSPESRARMVPYLDKFAVLKRSQGSGGVADIVFTAMVRDCFPNGVCWRSRRTNPVNKWYFERSRGTWKLNDSNWTMFWTTSDLDLDKQKFLDYEAVCRGVVPSWTDTKAVVD